MRHVHHLIRTATASFQADGPERKIFADVIDFSLPFHDPVLIFAVVMLIVLLAPLAFARLRVPGLVGLIVCGAIVGPSGLGLLERDGTMILLGTVGLLYLMFVAGLSLDLGQFQRQRSRSLVFGLASFLIPQVLGIVLGLYLLGFGVPAAVLLGSIVGSHTLLAYPVANRLGITKNMAVIMTMGGTIVTDMLALLLLAVVVGATEGALGLAFWIRFVGLIGVYLAFMLFALPRLGRWFLRATRGDANLAFVFLVTALFVTAYLADLAGLAPIIGAFLAGLVLNRLVPEMGALMSRVKFVGETLFIPFFLLSVGMLVDFGVLVSSLDVWYTALIFFGIVVIGKGMAAKIAAAVYRYSAAETWVVFGLSTPQAAATLAVTLVGFDLGLFGQVAVNAVVVMILLTCLLGPWLVERYGRGVVQQEETRPYDPGAAPQRILIPLSNPSTADTLVDLALAIRRDDAGDPVFPLVVVPDGANVAAEVAAGEKLVGHAVVRAVAADVPVTPMTRVDMDVARGITRAITERRISHVVIGWGGAPRSRQRIFGRILDRLLELSRVQVLVCRLTHPVGTHAGVVVVVPPLAEREPGFDEMLRTVKLLAARSGGHLVFAVEERSRHIVEAHARAARPEVPFTLHALDRYHRLFPELDALLKGEELVVLVSARESQRSWRPLLDRLPRLFTERFPGHDFVALYPPAGTAAPVEPVAAGAEAGGLPPVRLVQDLPPAAPAEALRTLLESAFDDAPHVAHEIARQLLREADLPPEELAPGIVLFHLHTPLVTSQIVLAGVSREGIRLEPLTQAAGVMLVLLNPADLPPEQHLRALAHLARAVHEACDSTPPSETVLPERLLEALSAGTPARRHPEKDWSPRGSVA